VQLIIGARWTGMKRSACWRGSLKVSRSRQFSAEALSIPGTFLLRDSAQIKYLFSVSFRRYDRTLHARIEHLDGKFSFDIHDSSVFTANKITELIENYKDPSR
jgi:hypothetical protein